MKLNRDINFDFFQGIAINHIGVIKNNDVFSRWYMLIFIKTSV